MTQPLSGDAGRDVRRVVVKIGSSVLTDGRGRLLPDRLDQLADQVAASMASGTPPRQPIVVSSGAIACGMAVLGLSRRPTAMAQLQACAAIGQSELMGHYARAFGRHGLTVGQILLTQDDLVDKARLRNAKQTLLTLLHRRVVPIVNENDTVAVEEITFGDNDRLAAVVAAALDAQLLVMLSDVEGLLREGRLVERIEALHGLGGAPVSGRARATTKGGMASKIEAARLAGRHGIPTVIANGTKPEILTRLLGGQPVGTLFVPPRERLTPKKWWIAFGLRQPAGQLVVDGGASRALSEQGRSLLASGVRGVRGRFDAGSFVSIMDEGGGEVGRGVCALSSAECARVLGLKSEDAARLLGRARMPEVVHRDQLVLAREVHGNVE